ncbi:MAG: hypothetical protein O6952_06130, partial [Planctomycetota bacterium]|nr:hypothetical protein [Planctomycetota bacterium]
MKSAHRTSSTGRFRLFARVGALALLVTAQGCGYVAVAVIAATSGGSSSGGRPANVAPTVTISSPVRATGNIDIDYTLSDPNGDNASITVEHAIIPYPGTGVPMPADWVTSTQGGGDPIANLTTSSGGDTHQFIWDAGADLPGGPPYDAAYVRIRITPQDADSPNVMGNVVETANFIAGNNAPSATVQTPTGIQSGLVQIDYTLLDSTDDLVDIAVDFSTDGGLIWAVANNIPVGETANLTSTLAGEGHNFAWDSIADNVDNSSLVRIRITPTDSLTLPGQETPVETGDFTIQNNTPPIIFISTPVDGSLIGGDVNISYLLLDANDDLVDILVEYSTDGWVTSSVALEKLGGGSEGTTALPSSAMGISHLFQWDSALDLPDVDLPNPSSTDPVQIMITPMDPFGPGNSFIATGLQLNNNSEPSVTVTTPSSPQVLGDVTIDYTLFDFDSDIAGIRVEYSTDGGQNFISCSERTGPPS